MRSVTRLLIPMLLVGAAASAQTITRGGLTGRVQTFRAVVGTAPTSPVTILTTPAARQGLFILTQACSNNSNGSIFVGGNPPLTIVSSSADNPFRGNARCVTFTPGLALPAGTAIMCNNLDPANSNSCLVTGVLSRK